MRQVDLLQVPLDGCCGVGALGCSPRKSEAIASLEFVECKRGSLSIATSHLVHHLHGFLVLAFTHEEFGRLVDGEEDEATEEHGHCDTAEHNHQVSPSHVLAFGTIRVFLFAGQITQQRPCYQRSKDLGERPVDGQNSQQPLMAPGQEFQEDRRINRQITAHADTPQACEDADGSETGRPSCRQAKHGGDTNREVEGPSAAKNVAAKAPEDSANEESDVLRKGEIGRAVRLKFETNRWEDERSGDGPEVVLGPAEANDYKELGMLVRMNGEGQQKKRYP